MLAAVVVLAFVAAATSSAVVELNPTTFPKMLQSDEIYITAFTAPWCGKLIVPPSSSCGLNLADFRSLQKPQAG